MSAPRKYEQGEGKDWNVKESIAYGRGFVHDDFCGLQADLNLFSGKVGFDRLELDGFLGPKTVEIWNSIYQASLKVDPAATVQFPAITEKEQLAALCQHVRLWLMTKARGVLLRETQAAA
jgi:hypothetical protein